LIYTFFNRPNQPSGTRTHMIGPLALWEPDDRPDRPLGTLRQTIGPNRPLAL